MDIVIALDTYDDIFSDFDIRGYGERAFSVDFLDELRLRLHKAGRESRVDIVLLMPAQDRNADDENLILDRMRGFFEERRKTYGVRKGKARRDSLLFIGIGLAFFILANFMAVRLESIVLFKDFLLIPAWFFVWSGLELLIRGREELLAKERYYRTLSAAGAAFGDREAY